MGVEGNLAKDKEKLQAEEAQSSPSADKIKALTSAIDEKNQHIVELDADIAASISAETNAKARLDKANSQSTERAAVLEALLGKLGPARNKVTTTASVASSVDRQQIRGGADAIVKIATGNSGLGSLVAACLAWTAKNGSGANPKMIGYCDMIIAKLAS